MCTFSTFLYHSYFYLLALSNPNEGEKVDYTWPQYDSESKRHLTVQMPIGEGSRLHEDRYKLWQETIKSI